MLLLFLILVALFMLAWGGYVLLRRLASVRLTIGELELAEAYIGNETLQETTLQEMHDLASSFGGRPLGIWGQTGM